MAANKLQQRNAIRKFSFHAEARKSNKRERDRDRLNQRQNFGDSDLVTGRNGCESHITPARQLRDILIKNDYDGQGRS